MKKLFLLLTLFISLTASAGERLPLNGNGTFYYSSLNPLSIEFTGAWGDGIYLTADLAAGFTAEQYPKCRIELADATTQKMKMTVRYTDYDANSNKNDISSSELSTVGDCSIEFDLTKNGENTNKGITRIMFRATDGTPSVTIKKFVLIDKNGNEVPTQYSVKAPAKMIPSYSGAMTALQSWKTVGTWETKSTTGKSIYIINFDGPTPAEAALQFVTTKSSDGKGRAWDSFGFDSNITSHKYVTDNADNKEVKLQSLDQMKINDVNYTCHYPATWGIASLTRYDTSIGETLEINSTGISSFVTEVPLDFTNVNATVYVVENSDDVKDDVVKLTKVEKVNPGAYFILGNPGTINNIPLSDKNFSGLTQTNLLSGKYAFSGKSTPDMTRYALSNVDGRLHPVDENVEIPAGKAYLELPTSAGARALTLSFDNSTTGVETFEAATNNNAATFNIAGQRVDSSAKGIVIKNGKKYFNK